MSTTVFVPNDTTAVAAGADAVAQWLQAHFPDCTIVRNGSRGLAYLEPLIEIEHDGLRHAFGNIDADACKILFQNGIPDSTHPDCLGVTDKLPGLKKQTRLTFAHVGIADPLDFAAFAHTDAYCGLRKAIEMPPQAVIDEIKTSGLRGRGGAGFPAGIKWQTVADTASDTKYIVCNADEGDSGTFADRLLMEGDPLTLIAGMIVAGYATAATRGYIYLRSEYPHTATIMQAAIDCAYQNGILGENACNGAYTFDLGLRIGAGAYICGEETALLDSLEGKRGVIRYKPPLPAISGAFGKPTLIHNVITLATVPTILQSGGHAHATHGIDKSRGTLTIQLAGNIKRGGLYELPFGIDLNAVLHDIGGGTKSGRPIKAVQVGGPLGAYFPPEEFDTPLDYEAFAAKDALVGHGGIVVFDDTINMADQARFAMEFCAHESCGKCTPCRIGSTRGVEVIDRITHADTDTERNAQTVLLHDLCDTMEDASLCALGGLTPYPVRSTLRYFPDDFCGGSHATSQRN